MGVDHKIFEHVAKIVDQDHAKFERLIERLHRLLARNSDEITWNDRIIDPDNESRTRQIDITIRNGKQFTIIECRFHRKPQDVKWIEELIGRRISFRADAAIAVSASGFTEGAAKKASAHGIFARDFKGLTESEVLSWGKQSQILINYMRFEDVVITYSWDYEKHTGNQAKHEDLFYEMCHKICLDSFDKIKGQGPVKFEVGFNVRNLVINDKSICYVSLSALATTFVSEIETSAVLCYGSVAEKSEFRDVIIECFPDIGDISHTESSGQIAIDFSSILHPENTIFHSLKLKTQAPKDMKLRVVKLGDLNVEMPVCCTVIFKKSA